ncbi:MAG: PRC-barrel domain-containing protein [Geminicoccales bacterium]
MLALAAAPGAAGGDTFEARASRLIGKSVIDPAREDLGRIAELVVDTRNERVRYVVLSLGGWFGGGAMRFAVPLLALTPAPYNGRLMLDRGRERMLAAPGFDRAAWPAWDDEYWSGVDLWYGGEARDLPASPRLARLTRLLGREVVDPKGAHSGEIRDLAINLASGKVLYVALDPGGELPARLPLRLFLVPEDGADVVLNVRNP